MLRNFRIGTRLGVSFGVIMLAFGVSFIAVVFIGLTSARATDDAVRTMNERTHSVQQMMAAQLEAAVSVRDAAAMNNARDVKAALKTYDDALARLQREESSFSQRGLDEKSKSLLESAVALRGKSEPIVAEAMDFVMSLAGEEGARVLRTKLAPVQAEWVGRLKELAQLEQRKGQEHLDAINRAKLSRLAALGVVLLLINGVGVCFAVLLTRSVTRPLAKAVDVAEHIARGELGLEFDIKGKDEAAILLRSMQAMARQLSEMVLAVRQATDSISVASQEINGGNIDLSSRTERQAAALQQTSASLSELTCAVALNTEHAGSARLLAERTASSANDGGKAMSQVIGTMSRISDSSKRIADIIGVIDGIAFQTNILALNAAVEAARAGEQGRGFAVVASEVRALAQRVTSAASEVRALIAESVVCIGDGSRQVTSMGETMTQLVDCSEQVKELIKQIAEASNLQRQTIGAVDGALRDVDGSTQQNAALVEQVAAAAQSLVNQTQSLSQRVGRFRIGLGTLPTTA